MDRAGPILRDGFLFAEIKFKWVISGEYIDLYGTGSVGVWGGGNSSLAMSMTQGSLCSIRSKLENRQLTPIDIKLKKIHH